MNEIHTKIEDRLDRLDEALKARMHLEGHEGIIEVSHLIDQVSKYWRILNDEQRDFIHAARYAIEEQVQWK